MSLQKLVEGDFLKAFKGKQESEVSVLRMLKSALVNKMIEKKINKDEALPDSEVIAVIKTEIKKRLDSVESYNQAQRPELAEKEKAEADLLLKYLPEQLSEETLVEIVEEVIKGMSAGPADFGKVMGAVMAKVNGQADGQVISKMVKEKLS